MTILQENLTQKFVTFVGIFGDFAGRNSAILCLGSGKFGGKFALFWWLFRCVCVEIWQGNLLVSGFRVAVSGENLHGSGKFGVLTWAVLRVIIGRDGAEI